MQIFSPKIRDGAPRKRRLKVKWKPLGKIFLWLVLAGVLAAGGVFAWFARDLPSPGKLSQMNLSQSTKIYDRTGTHLLYEIHGNEKRTEIPFSDIPDSVKYATISLEDQNFYTNSGIEITSIFRAGLADVLHLGAAQGASTITQQLVKISLLTSQKTLSRKIKEAILAIEIDQRYSKDNILDMYLNEIPYGSNAYGIEAAAETYFGVHANQLTLDEAALLASLPQAPTYYSPYGNNTQELLVRQHYALDQMAKLGYITQAQAAAAKKVDVLAKIKPPSQNMSAPHFVMYVKQYLEAKYGDDEVENGGLRVITTLDWDKQQAAEKAIDDFAQTDAAKYNANNEALVAMDPNTGQILAMVGSKNYFGAPEPAGCTPGVNCKFEGNFNVATAARQPGSSFKPYVYLTAFEKGFTPETQLWDVDTNFSTVSGQTYDPKNYDDKNRGLLQMKNALAESLNVPSVKTLYLAGVNASIDTAHKMGITTLNDPKNYGLSLVLGGGEVTLLDHVDAYSTFATGGIHHPTTTILQVQDSSGKTLEQYQSNPGTKVVDQKYVAMIDSILDNNALRAPTFGANSPLNFSDRPVAVKTGTTNDFRDGWTIGYTPSLVTGVWAGNNDNSSMAPGSDGVFVAAPIWHEFMAAALQNSNVQQFPEYTPQKTGIPVLDGQLSMKMKDIKVCQIQHGDNKGDYCLANDSCPSGASDKKSFVDAHSILYYVNKDNPLGPPPSDPASDPQFNGWESAIKKYLKDNHISGDAVPTVPCQDSFFSGGNSNNGKPNVSIDSPSDGDTITDSSIPIQLSIDSPNGILSATISINGTAIYSRSNDNSFTYTYQIPDNQKATTLDIGATVVDNDGDSASTDIHVTTNVGGNSSGNSSNGNGGSNNNNGN
jgi:1A family penicillin-binding protein